MTVIATRTSAVSPRRRGRHRKPSKFRRMPLALLVLLGLTLLVLPMTAAALPVRAGPADPEPRFSWPLTPVPSVTRPFEAPADPYGPGHRGVDLGGAAGQQVLAAGPGVVVFAGPLAGRGVLSIDHDGGLRTTYEPVTPLVAAGDQVYRGQPVATLDPGHPGCPVAACVHWAVRRGEEYLNPLELIQVVTALRLKPWEGGDAGEPLIRSGR